MNGPLRPNTPVDLLWKGLRVAVLSHVAMMNGVGQRYIVAGKIVAKRFTTVSKHLP